MLMRLSLIAAMFLLVVASIRGQTRVKRDVVFRTVDGQDLKLDVHYPEGAGPFPVAVVIHGGGWSVGSKRSMSSLGLARILTRAGVASACISYRLAPGSTFPAQIEDCRYAVQWVRSRGADFELDPSRVAAVGSSAGGHLAALLGAQRDHAQPGSDDPVCRLSTRPDFVLSFFGPMDLDGDPAKASTLAGRRVLAFLGVKDVQDPAASSLARAASPFWQIQDGAPPFLFIHGTEDPIVPIEQSEKMARALDTRRVPNLLVPVPRGGHGDFTLQLVPDKTDQEPEYWTRAQAFMRAHWLDQKPQTTPSKPFEYEVQRNLVYAVRPGRGDRQRSMKLDLYVPKGKGPWPVVVALPGGGWRFSSRRMSEVPLICRAFAREGIAAAAVSYRTAPANPWPAQFLDTGRAIQWLRANAKRYGLDPARIMTTGTSAGGHLASSVGTKDDLQDKSSDDPVSRQSSRPCCVVGFSAPTWLEPEADKNAGDLQVRLVHGLVGLRNEDDPKEVEKALGRAKDASPVVHATRDDVPHLLIHGKNDRIVPFSQAIYLRKHLQKVGVSCEVVEVQDRGHGSYLGLMRNPDRFFKTPPDWWLRIRTFVHRNL